MVELLNMDDVEHLRIDIPLMTLKLMDDQLLKAGKTMVGEDVDCRRLLIKFCICTFSRAIVFCQGGPKLNCKNPSVGAQETCKAS